MLYGDKLALDRVDSHSPRRVHGRVHRPRRRRKVHHPRARLGREEDQRGRVEVLGGDIGNGEHRRSVCPRIAYMPQGLGKNLYPTLSVLENVEFFGRLFGQGSEERAWRTRELLAATDLTAFADRPAGKLSGGMKQKLGLCCSLIHDPDLLILDEPTTGVDPLSRRQFWDLIDRIRARRAGLSVLVATAYMEEADRFDWLAAMDAGRVLGTGTPEELRARRRRHPRAGVHRAPARSSAEGTTHWSSRRASPPTEARRIEARDLTCRFGDFTAVDHVSFASSAARSSASSARTAAARRRR